MTTEIVVKSFEKRYIVIGLALLGLGLLFLAMWSQNAAAAYDINWNGGHIVSGTETYVNKTITLQNFLDVPKNTKLILKNCTVDIISVDITVEGTMEVRDYDHNNKTTKDRSVIEATSGSFSWWDLMADTGSNLLIEYSKFTDGNIMIMNTNTTIRWNMITQDNAPIYAGPDSISTIDNNTIIDNNGGMTFDTVKKTTFTHNYVHDSHGYTYLSINYATMFYMKDNVIVDTPAPLIQVTGPGTIDMNNDTVSYTRSSELTPNNVYITNWDSGTTYLYMDNCNLSNSEASALYISSDTFGHIKGNINKTKMLNNNADDLLIDKGDFTIDGLTAAGSVWGSGIDATYSHLKIYNSTIINNAGDGIYVYNEITPNLNLVLSNDNVSNNGANGLDESYNSLTTIDNCTFGNNSAEGIIISSVNTVDIRNTTVADQSGGDGVYLSTFNTVNFYDNKVISSFAYGTMLQDFGGSATAKVMNNLFKDNGNPKGAPNFGSIYTNVIFRKNTIQGGYDGFYTDMNYINTKIVVDQNTIRSQSEYGIYIHDGNATVTKNTIRGSGSDQIYLNDLSDSIIDNNDIRNGDERGIYVQFASIRSFSGNTVINHTNNEAIYLYYILSDLKITKNNVDLSEDGVYYYFDWNWNLDLVFDNNTVSNTTDNSAFHGEYYASGGDVSVQNNKFYDNEGSAVYFNHYAYLGHMYVRKNTIVNSTDGFGFYWNNQGYRIGYMDFSKNTIDRNQYIGYVNDVNKLDVRNNLARGNLANGLIFLSTAGPLNVTDNVITGNCKNYFDGQKYGLRIYDGQYTRDPAIVLRNNISDNNNAIGFQLQGYGKIDFENNIMSGNYYGADMNGISLTARNNVYDRNTGQGGIGAFFHDFYGPVHIYNDEANSNDQGMVLQYIYGQDTLIDHSTYNDNNNRGIAIYSFSVLNGKLTLTHVTMNKNGNYGVEIQYLSGLAVRIDNGTALNNRYEGYYIHYIGSGSSVMMDNVTADGGEMPIYVYEMSGPLTVHDSYIANGTYGGLSFSNVNPAMNRVYNNHFYNDLIAVDPYQSNALIEKNTIVGGRYGVYPGGSGDLFLSVPNNEYMITIRNNTFIANRAEGVHLSLYQINPASGIYDNSFTKFGTGINVYGNDDDRIAIFNNRFTQGGRGISVQTSGLYINNNSFSVVTSGIETDETAATLAHNTFDNCWQYCIASWNDNGLAVMGNDFSYSTIGVYTEDSSVLIQDNSFGQSTYGAKVNNSFATLISNTFTDDQYGICVESYTFATIIDGSYINNTAYGIWSEKNTMSTLDVKGTVPVTDSAMVINGGVLVEKGGMLDVTGSQFSLRSIGSISYILTVNAGGSLVAEGSTFKPVDGYGPFSIEAKAGSTLKLTDCTLDHLGTWAGSRRALYLATSDVVLEKVSIKYSAGDALFIEGKVYVVMRNGTIAGSRGYDVYIQDASTLRMGRTKFDMRNVKVLDTSKIIVDRAIEVTALNDADRPYKAVSVTVTDGQGATTSGSTGADGKWFHFFDGAIISATGIADTNLSYKVSLTDGKATFNDTAILSDDFARTYRFGTAPVVLNGPKIVVFDEDTTYVLDLTKYFFDNDPMTYTVSGEVSLTIRLRGNGATIIPAKDWYGTELVTLTATDTHNLTSTYQIYVTVRPVNDPPVISGVPDLVINTDTDYTLDLRQFIYDPDTPLSNLTVTVSSQYATVHGLRIVFNYPFVTTEIVRITVSDGQGGSSQDILIEVIAGYNPPKLKGLPDYFNATEGEAKMFDLTPYVDNSGMNSSTVVITTSGNEVIRISGTRITVLFPNGPVWRNLTFTFSNVNGNRTFVIKFHVTPVNDPPEIADMPVVTVTEGQDYVIDLSRYISDIDTPFDQLTLTVNRGDVRVEGKVLVIHISGTSGLTQVMVTVSDGYLNASKPLRILVVHVNDAPVLVTQSIKADDNKYTFTVVLRDPDGPSPTVWLVLDGQRYEMEWTSGTLSTGETYTITKTLSTGNHLYHFAADDGSGAANSKVSTPEQTTIKVSNPQAASNIPILLLIIILIVIAIILLLMRGRSKEEPKFDEEEAKEEEEEPQEEEPAEAEPVEEEPEEAPEPEPEPEAPKPRKATAPKLQKEEVETEGPASEPKGDDLDNIMEEIHKEVKVKKRKVE